MNIPIEIWGLLSTLLAAISLIPYLTSIFKGVTKPHMFSWAIWTILTAVTFFLQYTQGAGPGAWPTAFSAVLCILILAASFKYGERNITRSDWMTFIAALLAIPLWLLTDNPALAAVWVATIDGLGFYPTFRKSWCKPYEEKAFTHGVSALKHILALLALSTVSMATAFVPAVLVVLNVLLVASILWRRRCLALAEAS